MTQIGIINSLVEFGYPESHAIDLFKKYSDEGKIDYLEEYIKAKRKEFLDFDSKFYIENNPFADR